MRWNDQHTSLALVLGTLLAVYLPTLLIAAQAPVLIGKLEAFQLGVITGGLLALARAPRGQRKEDGND